MRNSVITGTILTLLVLLIAVPAHTETSPLTGKKICLDPGHGGSATGAINEDLQERTPLHREWSHGPKDTGCARSRVLCTASLDGWELYSRRLRY